ncbi:MAG: L-aspartate oxidase [Candidatus Omnitrophota bacterium]
MACFESAFLVIGSGVAGLKAALEAAEHGTVHLVTKKQDFESNTNYAQGGIATVLDPNDSFEAHIRDTLTAGAGLCRRDSVELIVTHGPNAIRNLIENGVDFTRKDDGSLALGREGGHSFRRIVHAQDLTGREVEKSLLKRVCDHPRVAVFEHHTAIDLILDENRRCWGAWVWDKENGEADRFFASVTILCTGGCGLVYNYSTNPPIATGDGVAMAYRTGCRIANMEFIQFHPTAFYTPDSDRPFLISEAVRGEGAILRAKDGTAFMEGYHPLKDLAPRDIVARAIDNEMKNRGDDFCYLDVRHLGLDFFHKRFPNISRYCEEQGLNLDKDMIPIVPAAHYMCGGVMTDLWGAADAKGLFAAGEVSCTGVHGANRLASNSILEALVFSRRLLERAVEDGLHKETPPQVDWQWYRPPHQEKLEAVRLVNCRKTLRLLMWDYVGIVRSDARLRQARKRLSVLKDEIDSYFNAGHITEELLELRNLAQVSELIVLCALERKESRGLHYNTDYPDLSDPPKETIICKRGDGGVHIESVPIPE